MKKILLAIGNKNAEEQLQNELKGYDFLPPVGFKDFLVNSVREGNPDIIIIKYSLKGNKSLSEAIQQLKEFNSRLRIIVIFNQNVIDRDLYDALVSMNIPDIIMSKGLIIGDIIKVIQNPMTMKDLTLFEIASGDESKMTEKEITAALQETNKQYKEIIRDEDNDGGLRKPKRAEDDTVYIDVPERKNIRPQDFISKSRQAANAQADEKANPDVDENGKFKPSPVSSPTPPASSVPFHITDVQSEPKSPAVILSTPEPFTIPSIGNEPQTPEIKIPAQKQAPSFSIPATNPVSPPPSFNINVPNEEPGKIQEKKQEEKPDIKIEPVKEEQSRKDLPKNMPKEEPKKEEKEEAKKPEKKTPKPVRRRPEVPVDDDDENVKSTKELIAEQMLANEEAAIEANRRATLERINSSREGEDEGPSFTISTDYEQPDMIEKPHKETEEEIYERLKQKALDDAAKELQEKEKEKRKKEGKGWGKKIKGLFGKPKEEKKQTQVITFIGTREGVGTSTVAFNYAYMLSRNNFKVLYAQLDGTDSISYLYSIENVRGICDMVRDTRMDCRKSLDEYITHGVGLTSKKHKAFNKNLDFLAINETSSRDPVKESEIKDCMIQFILNMQYDYIVFDVSSKLSNYYTINAMAYAGKIYYVVSQDVYDIGYLGINYERCVNRGIGMDGKIDIVVNKHEKNLSVTPKRILNFAKMNCNPYTVPYGKRVSEAAFLGEPYFSFGDNDFDDAIKKIGR